MYHDVDDIENHIALIPLLKILVITNVCICERCRCQLVSGSHGQTAPPFYESDDKSMSSTSGDPLSDPASALLLRWNCAR